ncbi:MAG: A/G-specific adenine glycosylase [Gemmatimonadota bacterium]
MPVAETDIAAALLRHFDQTRRGLPWRETADPYAIWVSEVMLQQTRVETVVPYWERWLERFPTVERLADAELDDVLKHWEGLGYYSRARNLHAAARVVRERYHGALPEHPAELRTLPGVGAYTAGAVASIAFGVPTPAVDGNARRVLARLHDLPTPTPAELRELATALVPTDRPGDFNQALMELGATVCTPRNPDCAACPLADWCRAARNGVQERRPLPARRKPLPEEKVATAVVLRRDALLLVRRPLHGLLGGLWEFPPRESPAVPAVEPIAPLQPVAHTFSHKRVVYQPTLYRASAADAGSEARTGAGAGSGTAVGLGPESAEGDGVAWVAPERLAEYALPVAQQKIGAAARAWLAGG